MPTYYSRAYYTADGVTDIFSVPFPYLNKLHISVMVDANPTTFTWLAPNSIKLSYVPPAGAQVRILRDTSLAVPLVDFQDGAILRENELDTSNLQNFYLAQESYDRAGIAAEAEDLALRAEAAAELAEQLVGGAVPVVKGLTELRATLPSSVSYVWLAYRDNPGDGGHGMFRAVTGAAAGTYTDNGGTIIVPTGGDGSAAFLREHGGTIDPRWFGAKVDGTSNDAAAYNATIAYALTLPNAAILIPNGRSRIASPISIAPSGSGQLHINLSFVGQGRNSILLHDGAFALFSFVGLIHKFNASDFAVYSKTLKTNPLHALFYFPDGNSESVYRNILYSVEPGETTYPAQFYYCGTDKYNDTVSFIDCYAVYMTNGGGYHIGKGSSVWFVGGRVVGLYPAYLGSNGLYLSGDNGGVYVWATDLIDLDNGIHLTKDNGASNREVFLTHVAVDSCNVGLYVQDEAYITWTGAWAASCYESNIDYVPSANASHAILHVIGGTVYNAGGGRYSDLRPAAGAHGMRYNGKGRFRLSNVIFRDNRGRAFEISGANAIYRSSFLGCEFIDNATDPNKATDVLHIGGKLDFIDCTMSGTVTAILRDMPTIADVALKNCRGFPGPATPPVPASGVVASNDTGHYVDVYLRGTAVISVHVNGIAIYDYGVASTANVKFTLRPGDTYKYIYSAAPNHVFLETS